MCQNRNQKLNTVFLSAGPTRSPDEVCRWDVLNTKLKKRIISYKNSLLTFPKSATKQILMSATIRNVVSHNLPELQKPDRPPFVFVWIRTSKKESEWKCDFLHVRLTEKKQSWHFLSADRHQINTQFLLELMLRD